MTVVHQTKRVLAKLVRTEDGRDPFFLCHHVGDGQTDTGRRVSVELVLGTGALLLRFPDESETWVVDPVESIEAILRSPDPVHRVAEELHKQHQRWGAEHDDDHFGGELAASAAIMVLQGQGVATEAVESQLCADGVFPFAPLDPPTTDRRHQLVVAAAMLLSEVERLDRMEARGASVLDVSNHPQRDPKLVEREDLVGELAQARLALRNVLALARLRVAKADPEAAEHLVRFCASANVRPEILRDVE